jgi:transposase-like protein
MYNDGMSGKKQGKAGSDKSPIVAELPLACADETAAVEFFERRRWGDCPCCVHCGDTNVYKMTDARTGQRNRRFLWRCHGCKKQYTVRVGTVLEDSRIPLRHWAYAFWAACASKKGVSALQIKRQTGLSYKSALFLMHRIRFAMTPDHTPAPKLTGIVEMDETYCGGKPRYPDRGDAYKRNKRGRGTQKVPVVAVVQRGGNVRASVVDGVTADNLKEVLTANVEQGSIIMTDGFRSYRRIAREHGPHFTVPHHLKQYVDPHNPLIHTNTIEGFFSLLKRGLYGTFHAVSREHLHRYVGEFEFRYNHREIDDGARTEIAIRQANGKRLMYREPATKTG